MYGFITKGMGKKECIIHYDDNGVDQIERCASDKVDEKIAELTKKGFKVTYKWWRTLY